MNSQLCIIIHGFTGNPWEIMPLANALKQKGYHIATPLLPGHHHEKIRMTRATADEWIEHVEQLVQQSVKEYQYIHLIGFSMGSMIAAILASRHAISTLVLLSAPVYVATPAVLRTKVRNFSRRNRSQHPVLDESSFSFLTVKRTPPLSNVFQFQKVVQQAKKVIPTLRLPMCIIHSEQDEIADPRSSGWIYRVAPAEEKELHYLHQSGHVICQDCELDTVRKTVLNFLQHHSTQRWTIHHSMDSPI